MPTLSEVPVDDLSIKQVADVRTALGDAIFSNLLALPSSTVHAQARTAWGKKDWPTHKRLLDIGWILSRYEYKQRLAVRV